MGIKKDEPQFDTFTQTLVPPSLPKKPSSFVDFVRARFEANPDMDPEEYKRWIKILISSSLKRMD